MATITKSNNTGYTEPDYSSWEAEEDLSPGDWFTKSHLDPEWTWSQFTGKPTKQEGARTQQLLAESMEPAKKLAHMAYTDWQQAAPIRGGVFDRIMASLSGGDPTQNPMYAQGRRGVEDTYQAAKGNILSSMAEGGGMNEALGDVEMGRAQGLTDLMAQMQEADMNRAFGVATGAPADAYSGMAGASAGQTQASANLAAYMGQQQAAAGSSAGGLGAGIGALMGK